MLLVATLTWPSLAAPTKTTSKRTIKQLVALTLEEGGDKIVQPPLATNLGFSSSVKGKVLSYSEEDTSDHRGHDFIVVFDESEKPSELVWSSTFLSEDDFVDGASFRTALDGTLKGAVEAKGKIGHIVQTKIDLDAKETKLALKRARDFFLIEALHLKPAK